VLAVNVKSNTYKDAGVDIDEMELTLKEATNHFINTTNTYNVKSKIGDFGGIYNFNNSLLVSSTDGVGTKIKLAIQSGIYNTVGQDLVNHCVNDILTTGAKPLFFLDYFGTSKLDKVIFLKVIEGICKACKENNCALIGGETAELPETYLENEFDLVGTIVGAIDQPIIGKKIHEGDLIIGLPSSGLHTNGYSLARKVLFEDANLPLDTIVPNTDTTLREALMEIHISYLKPIQKLLDNVEVYGMAHITGGGLTDNVPRILPDGLYANIDRGSWKVPPIFKYISKLGNIDIEEMYRVFNMGIGMVVIIRPIDKEHTMRILSNCKLIGTIRKGN